MTRLRFAPAWMAILVTASACAGRAQPGGAPARDRETLTPAELAERPFYTLYEAVETLRPLWLTGGPPDGIVQVYIDEIHVGGVAALRSIRIPSVSLIRHLDGIQAPARYGRDHQRGAILVTTRAAGR